MSLLATLPQHEISPDMEHTRVDSRQLRSLRISDFESTEIIEPITDVIHSNTHFISESAQTAAELRCARDRFAAGVQLEGNRLCYVADRAATLAVYQEALAKIDSQNHHQIHSEANIKIKTVLGIRQAEADDIVFAAGGMLLSPLEPQYAEPRIEFADDLYGYKAACRLKAWRTNGWPNTYPHNAVENEKKRSGGLGKEVKSAELCKRMFSWDEMDWGEPVDANPRSWDNEDVSWH